MTVVWTNSWEFSSFASALGNNGVWSLGNAHAVLPGSWGLYRKQMCNALLSAIDLDCMFIFQRLTFWVKANSAKTSFVIDTTYLYLPCPSSGSELVVLPSLSPDSSDNSEELPQRTSSLASKYSAAESATEGGPWDKLLTAEGCWLRVRRIRNQLGNNVAKKPDDNVQCESHFS